MNKEKVLECLKGIMVQLQRTVYPPLRLINNEFAYITTEVEFVGIKLPRVDTSHRDKKYIIEGVLDGIIDTLYYTYFSFSKYIKPENRTEMMNMVCEFYESSKIANLIEEIHPRFVWKTLLSELFEIMIVFDDDYINSIKSIVTEATETDDIRIALPALEEVVLNETEKLGIPRDVFISAFSLVHEANMAKRFPDGTFHRDKDKIIIKPPGWKKCNLDNIVEHLMNLL